MGSDSCRAHVIDTKLYPHLRTDVAMSHLTTRGVVDTLQLHLDCVAANYVRSDLTSSCCSQALMD